LGCGGWPGKSWPIPSLLSIRIGPTFKSKPKSPEDFSMDQAELLRRVVLCLEKLHIPYFVTGAMASIIYGEPRLTNDIDIVAEVQDIHITGLKNCFPDKEFHLDEDSVRNAVRQKFQFNIIHPESGLKVDVMIPQNDAYDQTRFTRKKRLRSLPDLEVNFASPEDVIIKKMQYYQEGRSEKHIRDIEGILRISTDMIDFDYISKWSAQLGLEAVWNDILIKSGQGVR
jgi:hypothetical protein